MLKFSHYPSVLPLLTQHDLCDFIKNFSFIFLGMNDMIRSFCDSKYHWFIKQYHQHEVWLCHRWSIWNYKECNSSSVFHFSTIFLLLFNILFSVFLYFCIWRFLNAIWLFLNLLPDIIYGTMSSRTICETECKKRRLNKIRWDWI